MSTGIRSIRSIGRTVARHIGRRAANWPIRPGETRAWLSAVPPILLPTMALTAVMALVAGALAPMAAAPATAAAAAVQAVDEPARIFQFNLCGAVTDRDVCPSKGGAGEGTAVPAIVSSILDFRPDVVTLNEACEEQVTTVLDGVRASGYAMDGRFGAAHESVPSCQNSGSPRFGNAVLSRHPSSTIPVSRSPIRSRCPTAPRCGNCCAWTPSCAAGPSRRARRI